MTCETPCLVSARVTAPPSAILRVVAGTRGGAELGRTRVLLQGAPTPQTVRMVPTAAGRRLVGDAAPGRISAAVAVTVEGGVAMDLSATVAMGPARPYPYVFGRSVEGRPMTVRLPDGDTGLLVMGAIHGDEPQAAWALARGLARVPQGGLRAAVVTIANPDGYARRTRRNAHDVDLNRNFPSRSWGPAVRPGPRPASEPETRAILGLMRRLAPTSLLNLHAPQRLVEDPDLGPLARWISRRTGLPLARSVGYATPGSLGDWSADRRLPEVTIELPRGGPSPAVVAAMADVLAGRAPG
ncbi:MAG: M14 family zinc carboxypeptidase [Thermoleophilia bacterium]